MAINDVNMNLPAVSRSQQPSLGVRRPWTEFFSNPSSYSLPCSLGEFASGIRRNLNYFLFNYVDVVCIMLFLSIIWHPDLRLTQNISMIMILWIVWSSLYSRHNNQLVMVVVARVIMTAVLLALTGLWLSAAPAGLVIVVLHAAFRISEDLFLDEEEAAEGGLLFAVNSKDSPLSDPISESSESPLVL